MIYLDNCATTQTDPAVAARVMYYMGEGFGNPSSWHGRGSESYRAVELARNCIARMLGAKTSSVYFTSGATESNNIALLGGAEANLAVGRHIVTTSIEHDSVLSVCRFLETRGWEVTYISPSKEDRRIHAEDILEAVREDTALVSLMFVNNETGEVLPIREIAGGVRKKNPLTRIHCDCAQGFGKLSFKLHEYDVDMVSASAHKIHGPMGVGALYLKRRDMALPLTYGGSQESGLHPGTENVPGISGFGLAADLALYGMREWEAAARRLRDLLCDRLSDRIPGLIINSPRDGSPFILNISIPGQTTDRLVSALSREEIYVSVSSACSRGRASHVLTAMGLGPDRVRGALRIGLSHYSREEEIRIFADRLADML